ncbi:MAG: hypothetical protein H6R14_2783 [Proteobacteria bacterium]|nr:hypothetical protein [Pseudomonadota bacterium]
MLGGLMQSLFRGGKPARERRRLPAAGRCPDVGKKICRRNMVMTVTDPMQPDLWDWLVLMGWRESSAKPERRRYTRLPETAMKTLIYTDRADREGVYRELIGGL